MRANRLTRWLMLGCAALLIMAYATWLEHNKEQAAAAAELDAERTRGREREARLLDQVTALQAQLAVQKGGPGGFTLDT